MREWENTVVINIVEGYFNLSEHLENAASHKHVVGQDRKMLAAAAWISKWMMGSGNKYFYFLLLPGK